MSQVQIQLMVYRFDNFYLDGGNRRLLRDGLPVALNSKYLDVLLLLVSRCGQLVEKASIFEEIWSGVFVTDAALTQCIKDIRKQLGDDAANPRYIKTVPKHGYVFIGEVIASSPADAPLQSAQIFERLIGDAFFHQWPECLRRIQFRAIGRQSDQGDARRHL